MTSWTCDMCDTQITDDNRAKTSNRVWICKACLESFKKEHDYSPTNEDVQKTRARRTRKLSLPARWEKSDPYRSAQAIAPPSKN